MSLPPRIVALLSNYAVSAPRERTIRDGMQSAFRIAGEPKRIHQLRRRAQNFFRGELAYTDHLKAVTRIGDDEAIFAENIEDGKAIRFEAAGSFRYLPVLPSKRFWPCARAEHLMWAKLSPTTKSGESTP